MRKSKTLSFNKLRVQSKIYEIKPTHKDYRNFKPNYNQRLLNESSVSKIFHSILERGSALQYIPILVDKNFNIHDGNHKYHAAIRLGIPFYIMEVPTDFKHMVSINSSQKNWTDVDFTQHWIAEGREPYVVFKHIKDENKFISYGLLAMMFFKAANRTGGVTSKQFKKGNLHLQHIDYVTECIVKFRKIENHAKVTPILPNVFSTQLFQSAMLKAFNNKEFDFSKFKRALAVNDHGLNIIGRTSDLYNEVIRLEGLG